MNSFIRKMINWAIISAIVAFIIVVIIKVWDTSLDQRVTELSLKVKVLKSDAILLQSNAVQRITVGDTTVIYEAQRLDTLEDQYRALNDGYKEELNRLILFDKFKYNILIAASIFFIIIYEIIVNWNRDKIFFD